MITYDLLEILLMLIPVFMTVISVTIFFVRKFDVIEEKLDVLSAAMIANYKANPNLDEARVNQALENGGFKPEDFMEEED